MTDYELALRAALIDAYRCAAELATELSVIYERRSQALYANVDATKAGVFPLVIPEGYEHGSRPEGQEADPRNR